MSHQSITCNNQSYRCIFPAFPQVGDIHINPSVDGVMILFVYQYDGERWKNIGSPSAAHLEFTQATINQKNRWFKRWQKMKGY